MVKQEPHSIIERILTLNRQNSYHHLHLIVEIRKAAIASLPHALAIHVLNPFANFIFLSVLVASIIFVLIKPS